MLNFFRREEVFFYNFFLSSVDVGHFKSVFVSYFLPDRSLILSRAVLSCKVKSISQTFSQLKD